MSDQLLDTVRKIHDLLELLAEDKIAQRDASQRLKIRQIAGSGMQKQAALLLMDGTRAQKDIVTEARIAKGNLSTLVSELSEANLLAGDRKFPRLTISIPQNFFKHE